jgi:hypothetical protein
MIESITRKRGIREGELEEIGATAQDTDANLMRKPNVFLGD